MATTNGVKNQVATRQPRPMSPAVAEVRTNINLMVEVMKSCMVKDMHFGVIPGVQKPSLFKAGAEKLMATFRLSADPTVEDLSKDGEIRFRVKVEIKAQDGHFVGAGIGECSSGEEKYMWRATVCHEEFEATPENLRRIKFKKGYQGAPTQQIQQVRVNPSDMANTILKMAKKRALVDGVLTATAASDLFSQDIEDLPAEYVESVAIHTPSAAPEVAQEAQRPAEASPEPSQHKKADKRPLGEVPAGASVLEAQFMVNGWTERKTTTGKDITAYQVEDTQGNEYSIERWGTVTEGMSEGSLATFFEIQVKEFPAGSGKRQYLAKKIVIDQ